MRLDERRQIRKASAAGLLADTLPSQVIGSETAKTKDERNLSNINIPMFFAGVFL